VWLLDFVSSGCHNKDQFIVIKESKREVDKEGTWGRGSKDGR